MCSMSLDGILYFRYGMGERNQNQKNIMDGMICSQHTVMEIARKSGHQTEVPVYILTKKSKSTSLTLIIYLKS